MTTLSRERLKEIGMGEKGRFIQETPNQSAELESELGTTTSSGPVVTKPKPVTPPTEVPIPENGEKGMGNF